jgi:hypothetical protein
MFRAAYRSLSEVLTAFAASVLHTINAQQATEIHAYKNIKENCTKRTQPSGLTRLAGITVCKPEAANTVRAPDDELSMNGGIINSVTKLHLVSYFY